MTHKEKHPLAGQPAMVDMGEGQGPEEFMIEDWWDLLTGGSWMNAEGNPAAILYAVRSAVKGLPMDNEVVYGKIGGLGHLVHVSELS